MKLPMREKYVDEAVGLWCVFGTAPDGGVDVTDGNRDVFRGLPPEAAKKVVAAQEAFRNALYDILCKPEQEVKPLKAVIGICDDGRAAYAAVLPTAPAPWFNVAAFRHVPLDMRPLLERQREACQLAFAELRETVGKQDLEYMLDSSHPDYVSAPHHG